MKLSDKGVAFIKQWESCRLEAYLDQRGVPTIGWGHTNGVHMGDICSQAMADVWFVEDTQEHEDAVNNLMLGLPPITQNQFDALVSFSYNVGSNAFARSTLARYMETGRIYRAANEFYKWVHAGKEVSQGLVNRRKAEAELFTAE